MSTPADEHPDALLADYSVDGLPTAQVLLVERHLATCPRCRTRLESLRTTAVLLRSLPEPSLPRSFTLRHAAPRSRRPLALPVSLLSAAAVLLLAFGLSLAVYPPRTTVTASTASRPAAVAAGGTASKAAAAPTAGPASAALAAAQNRDQSSAAASSQAGATSAAASMSQASQQEGSGTSALRRPFAAAAPSSARPPGQASEAPPRVPGPTNEAAQQAPSATAAGPSIHMSPLQLGLGIAGVACLLAGVGSLALARRRSAG